MVAGMLALTLAAAMFESVWPPSDAGVTGIGGVFFKVDDPQAFTAWYREHLGIEATEYGANFYWRTLDGDRVGRTVWTPFPRESTYFGDSDQQIMINYRVKDLEKLLAKLEEKGVERIGEIETYDYGTFAWIHDLEGNRVELWEPVDWTSEEYRDRMGGVDD